MTALLLAAFADVVSFLALPVHGEANPLVAAMPEALAVAAKVALALALVVVFRELRYRELVWRIGTVAWLLGAVTNLASR